MINRLLPLVVIDILAKTTRNINDYKIYGCKFIDPNLLRCAQKHVATHLDRLFCKMLTKKAMESWFMRQIYGTCLRKKRTNEIEINYGFFIQWFRFFSFNSFCWVF